MSLNSFRSSAHIVARQLSRPCTLSPLPAAVSVGLRLSTRHSQTRDHSQWLGSQCRVSAAKTSIKWRPSAPRDGVRTFKVRGHIVLTNYLDLPPDYTDEAGLPFRSHDLDATEVITLFGPYMNSKAANKLLKILHGRRVAGTLEDPTLGVNTAMYSREEMKIALDYLRKMVAVDEITNAGLRSEEELAKLEEPLPEGEEPPTVPGYTITKPSKKNGSVYGKSVFDVIREDNIAKRKARQEQEEAERIRKEEEAKANMTPKELEAYEQRKLGFANRPPSEKMQAYIDAATSDLEAPPEMTKWERILPSAVVVLLVSGVLIAYAAYYRPLKRADRLFPDIPPAAATVGALILANVLVYAAWKAPRLWPMLNKYFLVVPATPHPVSIFGAMFSHQGISHLTINMAVLWLVGTQYYDDIGRGDFLATYFTTGALGFLGTLTWTVLRSQWHLTTLGASGGVYGLVGAYFWMHRFEGFKLFGLPPDPFNGVPGLAFIATFIALNITAAFSKTAKWDVASHMVGITAGMVAGHILERRKEAKRRLLGEKAKAKEVAQTGVDAPAKPIAKP